MRWNASRSTLNLFETEQQPQRNRLFEIISTKCRQTEIIAVHCSRYVIELEYCLARRCVNTFITIKMMRNEFENIYMYIYLTSQPITEQGE